MDAVLAHGAAAHFGEVSADLSELSADSPLRPLARSLLQLGAREATEIEERFPKVQRRVGGYNLDALTPRNAKNNLAHILVGSEGTLAAIISRAQALACSGQAGGGGLPFRSVLRSHECRTASGGRSDRSPWKPSTVQCWISPAEIPLFRSTIERFVREDPEALLLVEFDEGDEENERRLKRLDEMMGDLGFSWDKIGAKWGGGD